MRERRRLTRRLVWVVVVLTALLLAAATNALAAGPEASIRFAPGDSGVTANITSWHSGWVSINQGQRLELHHNLGRDPEDLAVEMWFNDTAGAGWGINRHFYGGVEVGGDRFGAHWERLTDNDISVYRDLDDTAADQVFVAVWVANRGPDDYDSGWVNINAGQTRIFTHHSSPTIPVADLTVGLWFKNTAAGGPGINQWYYGGKEIAGNWVGAYWFNLTTTTVKVRRAVDDTGVDQVRIVVVHRTTPDFDESMTVVKGGGIPVDHDLDWEPTMLQVVAQCKSNITAIGINQLGTGGNYGTSAPFPGWQGAAIQSLTADQVTLYRFGDDTVCDQIRVRIWKRYELLNLPVIVRED